MIRLVLALALLTAAAIGLSFVADLPGGVAITLGSMKIETSLVIGLITALALGIGIAILVSALRFILRLPGLFTLGLTARRRHKGHLAVSRGMIAVGAGDRTLARRSATEAARLLGRDPLALLLSAQAAQMEGDRGGAERAFRDMLANPETRLLGLRGLHVEAQRKGDRVAALGFATETATLSPATRWATEALVEHFAGMGQWRAALTALEHGAKGLEKPIRKRWRAILLTAEAMALADSAPDESMAAAREAAKLAPDLVPAQLSFARQCARAGDYRRASRTLEASWKLTPHPDTGEAYLAIRPGDAARERLIRARKLAALATNDPESGLLLAGALIMSRDFDEARRILSPLAEDRPTVRTCLLMAELEELEQGNTGHVREWLGRASRAPRDPAWIVDGIETDVWAPVSPVTGRIDAFVWQKPSEAMPDQRITRIIDGALRGLKPHPVHPAHQIAEDPPVKGREYPKALEPVVDRSPLPAPEAKMPKLSASTFLSSTANEGSSAKPVAARKKSRRDVVFPLPRSPDDPGLGVDDPRIGDPT